MINDFTKSIYGILNDIDITGLYLACREQIRLHPPLSSLLD